MVKTIEFSQSQKKKNEQMAADFLAQHEQREFNTLFACLADNAQCSYLFKEIDLQKYYDMIMEEIKSKHYNSDEKLNNQSVNGIVKKYSEIVDIDEFVAKLKKLKSENII